MNDYSATYSTVNDCDCVEVERPFRVNLEDSQKKLYETANTLQMILSSLISSPNSEIKIVEPNCLKDSVDNINLMAEMCMGMAKRIQQVLFN